MMPAAKGNQYALGNNGGRPSKYDPKYCSLAIDFLEGGYSVTALAGEIGVSTSTLFVWAEAHQEFSESLKTGQAKAAMFWEKALIDVAKGGDGNATAAIFGVKNRSRKEWRDKQEVDHTSNGKTIKSFSEMYGKPQS